MKNKNFVKRLILSNIIGAFICTPLLLTGCTNTPTNTPNTSDVTDTSNDSESSAENSLKVLDTPEIM
ncbi:MAG: hypothetical protein E6Y39_11380, partial [Clostridium butyricum]|nr:hypothetical protein [Clostridium butyricum]